MDNNQHIVSFSGGKDSTCMLLMMLEKGLRVDRIINVDTTKEFPEMYAHIAKVQKHIAPLKIEIVKMDFDYWFADHVMSRGKRKGQAGYGFPESNIRWCTALKQEAFAVSILNHHYEPRRWHSVRAVENAVAYIGVAFDEAERAKKKSNDVAHKVYPLIEFGL